MQIHVGGQWKRLESPPWIFEFDFGDARATDLEVLTEDARGNISDRYAFTID
jgi:hypothetical protein